MNGRKSNPAEVAIAWLLAFGVQVSAGFYLLDGGRGWIFGSVVGIVFLIALVAGIAER